MKIRNRKSEMIVPDPPYATEEKINFISINFKERYITELNSIGAKRVWAQRFETACSNEPYS